MAEACGALADDPDAKALGGGTALLILIKQGVYVPSTLVNLQKIRGSAAIEVEADGWLRLGALASIGEVGRHAIVRDRYPTLSAACQVVANVRIRNLATIGGNVAHADYQSDPPAALTVLGARIELTAAGGSVRELPIRDFQVGAYETRLEVGEVVSAICLPPPEPGWLGAYNKFTMRSSEDRPTAGVAALVRLDGGRIRDVRVAIGATTPSPYEAPLHAALGGGKAPSRALFAELAVAATEGLEPIDDIRGSAAYKKRVATVLVERALAAAASETVA